MLLIKGEDRGFHVSELYFGENRENHEKILRDRSEMFHGRRLDIE